MTSKRYLGNIITDTPTEPTNNYEDSKVPGVWSLDEALEYTAGGVWPTLGNASPKAFVFQGGANTNISSFNMFTQGDTSDFGDFSTTMNAVSGLSNDTRIVAGAGDTGNAVVEYFSTASGGTGVTFGNLFVTGYGASTVNNSTRGIFAGSYNGSINADISYFTIATTGNAAYFGDMTQGRYRAQGTICSSTRGIFAVGYTNPVFTRSNAIEYITIASTGSGTDFGDDIYSRFRGGGASNSTRGLIAGGSAASETNAITYITIASTGNATDFGDLSAATSDTGGTANSTNAFFISSSFTTGSRIQYVTIATTGNSTTWGDQTVFSGSQYATSMAHGGLQ